MLVIGLSSSATGIYLVYFMLKFTLIVYTDMEAVGITNDSQYPLQIGSRKRKSMKLLQNLIFLTFL